MKTRDIKSANALLAAVGFLAFSLPAYSQKMAPTSAGQAKTQSSAPAKNRTPRTGLMSSEEKVVRDVYARLMRYHTAARDEQAATNGVKYSPMDYVVFELGNIHCGAIEEIAARPVVELVTPPPDEALMVTAHHLQYGNGPKHSSYDVAWTIMPSKTPNNDKLTVAALLASGGDRLLDIVRYTTFEVTIRLAGKERAYRAMALHHSGADSTGKPRAEILDSVAGDMNAVLADESPRVRSPWKSYVKSSLYLAVATEINKKERAGQPLIPADAPIGYLPGDDVAPADKQAMQLAAGCVGPITTDDVTVVGWVDGSVIDLPSGASPVLVAALNAPDTCLALVGVWALGQPLNLGSNANKAYANAFLVKFSANSAPPQTILPSAIQSGGDYRLSNRFKVRFSVTNGAITNLSYLQSAAVIGSTPNPCSSLLPSVTADAHQSNGANGVTASNTVYLLAEGRIGSTGRAVNQTINGRTTPWIWSVIKFNASGSPDASDAALFPTYYVYKNGQLIQTLSQTTLSIFIKKDETYQRVPWEIQ